MDPFLVGGVCAGTFLLIAIILAFLLKFARKERKTTLFSSPRLFHQGKYVELANDEEEFDYHDSERRKNADFSADLSRQPFSDGYNLREPFPAPARFLTNDEKNHAREVGRRKSFEHVRAETEGILPRHELEMAAAFNRVITRGLDGRMRVSAHEPHAECIGHNSSPVGKSGVCKTRVFHSPTKPRIKMAPEAYHDHAVRNIFDEKKRVHRSAFHTYEPQMHTRKPSSTRRPKRPVDDKWSRRHPAKLPTKTISQQSYQEEKLSSSSKSNEIQRDDKVLKGRSMVSKRPASLEKHVTRPHVNNKGQALVSRSYTVKSHVKSTPLDIRKSQSSSLTAISESNYEQFRDRNHLIAKKSVKDVVEEVKREAQLRRRSETPRTETRDSITAPKPPSKTNSGIRSDRESLGSVPQNKKTDTYKQETTPERIPLHSITSETETVPVTWQSRKLIGSKTTVADQKETMTYSSTESMDNNKDKVAVSASKIPSILPPQNIHYTPPPPKIHSLPPSPPKIHSQPPPPKIKSPPPSPKIPTPPPPPKIQTPPPSKIPTPPPPPQTPTPPPSKIRSPPPPPKTPTPPPPPKIPTPLSTPKIPTPPPPPKIPTSPPPPKIHSPPPPPPPAPMERHLSSPLMSEFPPLPTFLSLDARQTSSSQIQSPSARDRGKEMSQYAKLTTPLRLMSPEKSSVVTSIRRPSIQSPRKRKLSPEASTGMSQPSDKDIAVYVQELLISISSETLEDDISPRTEQSQPYSTVTTRENSPASQVTSVGSELGMFAFTPHTTSTPVQSLENVHKHSKRDQSLIAEAMGKRRKWISDSNSTINDSSITTVVPASSISYNISTSPEIAQKIDNVRTIARDPSVKTLLRTIKAKRFSPTVPENLQQAFATPFDDREKPNHRRTSSVPSAPVSLTGHAATGNHETGAHTAPPSPSFIRSLQQERMGVRPAAYTANNQYETAAQQTVPILSARGILMQEIKSRRKSYD